MASHGISVMLASADLIFISRYIYINFCINLLYRENQFLLCKTQCYFMSDFKLIKKACKANVDIFDEKN